MVGIQGHVWYELEQSQDFARLSPGLTLGHAFALSLSHTTLYGNDFWTGRITRLGRT